MRSLFSSSWYRFAPLKPRLRPHAEIHRQMFRGDVWYVLQDHQTGRFHRVSAAVNLMLNLMNGQRTVDEIWTSVVDSAKGAPPTQDETIALLSQLHAADLLQGDFAPDLQELSERSARQSRSDMLQRLRNPLSLRLPLFDPDRFLDALAPLAKALFSTAGLLGWLALVGTGLLLAALHWPELTRNAADRLLATENVLVILLVYPVIKTLHEVGHALATKRWGGEVHEVGLMMLIFVPVAYVDASSSLAFVSRRQRMVVAAAGIMVEAALAALAAIVWVNASPGLARTVSFNVMLIGGVSTLIFNGNPLLRFDGYYILSDLLGIPNLGIRANRYLTYFVQRHALKIDSVDSPATGRGEEKWLLLYALASFLYRVAISIGIAFFLASRLFFVGVAIAIWTGIGMVVLPCVSAGRFLFGDPRLEGSRQRALLVTGGAAAAVLGLLFVLPLPYATVAEGVIWIPERAEVRARTAGFVDHVLAPSSSFVLGGTPLVAMSDPIIESQVAVKTAQLAEMRERLAAAQIADRVQAEIIVEQINHLTRALALLADRKAELMVSAADAGRFVALRASDMPGRYVKKGELLGYVLSAQNTIVRTVVAQSDIDLVRQRTRRVDIRFVDDPGDEHRARIAREVPAADQEVPSLALTTQGGGSIAIDPGAKSPRPQALFGFFQFDVATSIPQRAQFAGERAFVRFGYGTEPVGWRMLRAVRETFLRQFHV